jgi:uncharacterized protein involved in type VI secretion and phage assembly
LKLPVEVIRTMSPFANAPHLRLDVIRPNRSLEVLSCKGAEVFNQPYSFELEVVSREGPLDAHDLLFSVAYLHSSAGISGIHGHIQSIVRSSTEHSLGHLLQPPPAHYRITLGPRD